MKVGEWGEELTEWEELTGRVQAIGVDGGYLREGWRIGKGLK